ncbi:Pkinase-domain-containing protein [Xylona heveae TC161]|uniref:Pkinase-domain-containing protein n=1 Tax=Xylona heveae (strain CBS 132557 / TC161) TaxID=1328760 RepID=A0A165GTP3_XYLHT|nr:Pkinase-domain-containing protein [Xylona heveae TC161]KZF22585.1 Pkinase-domain-containing protein [Xylona heveae TC161]
MATTKSSNEAQQAAGIMLSSEITVDAPALGSSGRPPMVKHLSTPAYKSPLRHHQRSHSTPRQVKETLNARSSYTDSQDGGASQHRINQYLIKQEIGRGSFGSVHLAVDQYGTEYAVKEFSKSRLRKRAQSNILRRPHDSSQRCSGRLRFGSNAPFHHPPASEDAENPLYLIKEEIAIMKKLHHPNLVSLIEVLDDPDEDSLYMVVEMCKKGVIMKVGLDERADPYTEEECRYWFRDLILGIEYLHAQGVVHRDIKPDNLLLTQDDVLKIVDFGVSEMFERATPMLIAKSAGSPAFLPPELCVLKHGKISGTAADIWSMGVTLYCLRFGRLPFEKHGMLELFESIRSDSVEFADGCDPQLQDLLSKILVKDPAKRLTIPEIRKHPWVTKEGTDPLLSAEENTAEKMEPPTEEEMNSAITDKMSKLLIVMKAVAKFKSLLTKRRPSLFQGTLGQGVRIVRPPLSTSPPASSPWLHRSKSMDLYDRRRVEQALAAEGVHRELDAITPEDRIPLPHRADSMVVVESGIQSPSDRHGSRTEESTGPTSVSEKLALGSGRESRSDVSAPTAEGGERRRANGKGHAQDPLENSILLDVGLGGDDEDGGASAYILSESPMATHDHIYEMAYQEEIDRIRKTHGRNTSLYLTRRVDNVQRLKEDETLLGRSTTPATPAKGGLASLVNRVRGQDDEKEQAGQNKQEEKSE